MNSINGQSEQRTRFDYNRMISQATTYTLQHVLWLFKDKILRLVNKAIRN